MFGDRSYIDQFTYIQLRASETDKVISNTARLTSDVTHTTVQFNKHSTVERQSCKASKTYSEQGGIEVKTVVQRKRRSDIH